MKQDAAIEVFAALDLALAESKSVVDRLSKIRPLVRAEIAEDRDGLAALMVVGEASSEDSRHELQALIRAMKTDLIALPGFVRADLLTEKDGLMVVFVLYADSEALKKIESARPWRQFMEMSLAWLVGDWVRKRFSCG